MHGHEGSAVSSGLRNSGDELASADCHRLLVFPHLLSLLVRNFELNRAAWLIDGWLLNQ
jgi:hypothetical protein